MMNSLVVKVDSILIPTFFKKNPE